MVMGRDRGPGDRERPLGHAGRGRDFSPEFGAAKASSGAMAISILPLTEVKAKLNELVEETVTTHERVTITRHGKPAVVLMAVEDLESMEETLYWQAQPAVHEDIQRP